MPLSSLFRTQTIHDKIDRRIQELRQEYYGRKIDENDHMVRQLHNVQRYLFSQIELLDHRDAPDEVILSVLTGFGVLCPREVELYRGMVTARKALPLYP